MKRIGCVAVAVVGACMLGGCGASGEGDGPMATVITDRPTPVATAPSVPSATSASPSTKPSASPST